MKIAGIYKIESKIKPNRIYIGSSINISNRWKNHLSNLRKNMHGNRKLQAHFNKYGESDLQFSVLLGCNKESLIGIEQYFIDSYKPSFNMCYKAGNSLGIKRSDESKKKMSIAKIGTISNAKGCKHSMDAIEKVKNANKGNKYRKGKLHTQESKEKNSKSHIGKDTWNKGRHDLPHHSEDHKKKISKSLLGQKRPKSIETRLKISNTLKGNIPWNKGKKGLQVAWNKGLKKLA